MAFGYAGHGSPVGYRRSCPLNHRDRKPLASLAEYEAYRLTLHPNARSKFNSAKWRMVARLLREGERFYTACRLAGLTPKGKETWLKLPEHLK